MYHVGGNQKRNVDYLKDGHEKKIVQDVEPNAGPREQARSDWKKHTEGQAAQVRKTATCSLRLLCEHSVGHFMPCPLLKQSEGHTGVWSRGSPSVGRGPFGGVEQSSHGTQSR